MREAAAALVGLVLATGCTSVLTGLASNAGDGWPPARPDEVLAHALAWVGVGLGAWLGIGCLLALAALLPGAAGGFADDLARRLTPAAARRALSLVLGATVASVAMPPAPVSLARSGPVASADRGAPASALAMGPGFLPTSPSAATEAATSPQAPGLAPTAPGVAAPSAALVPSPGFSPTGATAATDHDPSAHRASLPPSGPHAAATAASPPEQGPGFAPTATLAPAQATASPQAGPVPGFRPTTPVPVSRADRSRLLAPAPRATSATHDLVTVRRGDTLWSVAARHLGPAASDAEIARTWPAWHDANRDVIGDDPDLIRPGQQLRPPSAQP